MTGYAEIDAKLKLLEPKLQKKLTRQALRKGAKLHKEETEQIIEQETDYGEGAYAASLKVKSMKRSRTRIGVSVMPEAEKYFTEYESRYGKRPNPSPKHDAGRPHYVPASLEFGWTSEDGTFHPGIRAQRRGLYDNKEPIKAGFVSDMRELVQETGK
jgi:hypothetical protein